MTLHTAWFSLYLYIVYRDLSCSRLLSHFHLAFDLLPFSTIVLFLSLRDLFPYYCFPFPFFLCCCFLIFTSLPFSSSALISGTDLLAEIFQPSFVFVPSPCLSPTTCANFTAPNLASLAPYLWYPWDFDINPSIFRVFFLLGEVEKHVASP